MLAGRRELTRLLDELEPDRIEVSDRSTLRWTGRWARQRGVGSMMVSHESLAGLLGVWGMPARATGSPTGSTGGPPRCSTRSSAPPPSPPPSSAASACRTWSRSRSGWTCAEFHPSRGRRRGPLPICPARTRLLVVYCSRLSADKRPELAVDTVAALRSAQGARAVLVVAGDGSRRAALAYRAARLPVRFAGHIADRAAVAALLASADVVVAPGPVETFGLAALEALACGTPVVVNAASALPEVVGDAGVAVRGTPEAFADGRRAADGASGGASAGRPPGPGPSCSAGRRPSTASCARTARCRHAALVTAAMARQPCRRGRCARRCRRLAVRRVRVTPGRGSPGDAP